MPAAGKVTNRTWNFLSLGDLKNKQKHISICNEGEMAIIKKKQQKKQVAKEARRNWEVSNHRCHQLQLKIRLKITGSESPRASLHLTL